MGSINLPNALSLGRILLVPAMVALLLERWEEHGLAVFLIAALTDLLDGWVARRRNQVTTLGKLLDPLADKLLVCSAFIALAQTHPRDVKAWMVVIIVSREFAVTGLRNIASTKGVTLSASHLGKAKTVGQMAAIVLLLLGRERLGAVGGLVPIVLWAAVVMAFVSMLQYFVRFARQAGFD